MKESIFYIYVDKTDDGRVFYVGKGKKERLSCSKRNKYWHHIEEKYGHTREVVFATKLESYAFELEKQFIKKYKTCENQWLKNEGFGANLSIGGSGPVGLKHTEKTKNKLRELNSGKNNPMFGMVGELSPNFGKKMSEKNKQKLIQANTGRIATEESKIRMSISSTGKIHTEETKKKISDFNLGKTMSDESKTKIGNAHRGKIIPQEMRNRISKTKKENPTIITDETRKKMSVNTLGGKNPAALLNENNVIEIRKKYSTGKYSCLELSMEYNVSRSCVSLLVNGKTWKHISQEKVIKSNA